MSILPPLSTPAATLPTRLLGALRGAYPVSRKRKTAALAVAAAADLVQLVFWPAFSEGIASPLDDALDLVVAAILCLVLGPRPRLLLALAFEFVPGAALFPTWTAVVASIPAVPAPARRA